LFLFCLPGILRCSTLALAFLWCVICFGLWPLVRPPASPCKHKTPWHECRVVIHVPTSYHSSLFQSSLDGFPSTIRETWTNING
jgi:hypothetical protein